jgi:hypothetical protein
LSRRSMLSLILRQSSSTAVKPTSLLCKIALAGSQGQFSRRDYVIIAIAPNIYCSP